MNKFIFVNKCIRSTDMNKISILYVMIGFHEMASRSKSLLTVVDFIDVTLIFFIC